MSIEYLVDHGLYQMVLLLIGILVIGIISTYLHNKKSAEDEYLLVNTRTGKTASFKINNQAPTEEQRRNLCEKISGLFT